MRWNTGVSLVAFKARSEIDNFAASVRAARLPAPKFELAYTLRKSDLDTLRSIAGSVLSSHAPCPWNESYPNLGSTDHRIVSDAISIIKESMETAALFGASVMVLHPGYVTDDSVPADFARRSEGFTRIISEQQRFMLHSEGAISRPEYVDSAAYRRHLKAALGNLREYVRVADEAGIAPAIENLNPRLTYLFQSPRDVIEALDAVDGLFACLDLGHLWISSLVFEFNYIDAVRSLVQTGKVISTHIHNNRSTLTGSPVFRDDHRSIDGGNAPIGDAVQTLKEGSVNRYVIESTEEAYHNYELLLEMLAD